MVGGDARAGGGARGLGRRDHARLLRARRAVRHGRLEPRPARASAMRSAAASTCSTPPTPTRCWPCPTDGALFVIASKSGSTLEPEVMEEYFWALTGGDGSRFVAITDPGSKLAARAEERGFRRTFLNRADIGGRFSALSYFGLVPAALAGIAIDAAARQRRSTCWSGPGPTPTRPTNAPLQLGALLGDSVAAGPRQADDHRRPGGGLDRALARAADRRVDGQAGHRRGAAGGRAARAAGGVRRRPAVRLPAPRRHARRRGRRASRAPASTSSAASSPGSTTSARR